MESKLDAILESLKVIHTRLDNLEKDSSKMSDHIQFIHRAYNVIRGPLGYIKYKIDSIVGTNSPETELPLLENNNTRD